mmetsp:Transcript_75755/g.214141  ORF Transcript_75755/g.214141 Transcript_75755/m.214141 type:complete len:185 (+) Transcript_75755:98-652(+)
MVSRKASDDEDDLEREALVGATRIGKSQEDDALLSMAKRLSRAAFRRDVGDGELLDMAKRVSLAAASAPGAQSASAHGPLTGGRLYQRSICWFCIIGLGIVLLRIALVRLPPAAAGETVPPDPAPPIPAPQLPYGPGDAGPAEGKTAPKVKCNKNWCKKQATPWALRCTLEKCGGCPECAKRER